MIPARLVPDDAVRPASSTLPPPWPGRYVDLDDQRLYVRETPGTAPGAEPALFLHGLGGSSQNWTDLADLLSDRVDGQAIDLPGFGRSDAPPPGGYSQRALADVAIRWVEESGRGPVHLFGNSLGGAIAVRVAALRPDLVRTLTLISPAMPVLRPRRSHRHMLPVLVVPRVDRIVARLFRNATPEQMAQGVIDVCFARQARVPAQRRAEAVEEASYRLGREWAATAYVATLRGLVSTYLVPGARSPWRLAASIEAPTLVIGGRRDQLVHPRVAVRTARIVPDSRLLMLPGVGHTAQMEVPRTVARAAAALLDGVSRSALR